MEELLGILILGICFWMLTRSPLKFLFSFLKVKLILILGVGAFIVFVMSGRH
jgi:hypothetical protein